LAPFICSIAPAFFPQHADARQVAIAFHEIEPVTDDEFIFNFEPIVICINMAGALFLFA